MSLSVCDYEPCANLQAALQKLVIIPEGASSFQLVVVSKGRPLRTFYVPLLYCPFCGTRIEEEWVEAFMLKTSKKAKAS
jgi:hypothetical protein